MGDSLQGRLIANTYPGLIKTSDNSELASGTVRITDGCGNDTALLLGTNGQPNEFSGGLTVTGAFNANSISYPTSIGTANHVVISDGSAGLSVGQVPSAGLADLSPSPAGTGSVNKITVNAKGQVTAANLVTPGICAFSDHSGSSRTFTFPDSVHYVKFHLTGGGAKGLCRNGGAGATMIGFISGFPGKELELSIAPRQNTEDQNGFSSCIHHTVNSVRTEIAAVSGGQQSGGRYVFAGGRAPNGANDNGGITSFTLISGGGGGIDTGDQTDGREESEGGSSFWGSPPSYGAGNSKHNHGCHTVREAGTGYIQFEWS